MKPLRPLTDAQRRVAACVVDGLSYREIATKLGCGVRTVRSHVDEIANKLPPPAGAITPYKRVLLWASSNPSHIGKSV